MVLAAHTVSAETIFVASFDEGTDGFAYIDDAFLGTQAPAYAEGARRATGTGTGTGGGGALGITLGNHDARTIEGMSGGWSRAFVLDGPMRELRIVFRYRLTQASGYEPDEYSQVMVLFDGAPLPGRGIDIVARIAGDGDSGPDRSTGWLVFSSSPGSVRAGRHVLTIGGYNNKKTVLDESTEILIDDVRVSGTPDVACRAHADCDDANPCTDDTCESGRCVSRANTTSCSDGFRYSP